MDANTHGGSAKRIQETEHTQKFNAKKKYEREQRQRKSKKRAKQRRRGSQPVVLVERERKRSHAGRSGKGGRAHAEEEGNTSVKKHECQVLKICRHARGNECGWVFVGWVASQRRKAVGGQRCSDDTLRAGQRTKTRTPLCRQDV